MIKPYEAYLSILIDFAISEGFKAVELDYKGISDIQWSKYGIYVPKLIRIQGGHTAEIQVYFLLHELGHHLLRCDWVEFAKNFPITHYAENNGVKYRRRISYLVASVEEEYKAWDEGLKLAERLGIPVCSEKWEKLRSKCLMGYIRFYGSK